MTQGTEAPDRAPKVHDIDRVWFKVFNDILTDMRFITMSLETQAVWLRLVTLSNHRANVGRVVGSRKHVAVAIRVPEKKLAAALEELERQSIIFVEGETIIIADERHYVGPGLRLCDTQEAAAERVRKTRAKAREEEAARVAAAASCNSYTSRARRDQLIGDEQELEDEEHEGFHAFKEEENNYQIEDEHPLGLDPDVPLL